MVWLSISHCVLPFLLISLQPFISSVRMPFRLRSLMFFFYHSFDPSISPSLNLPFFIFFFYSSLCLYSIPSFSLLSQFPLFPSSRNAPFLPPLSVFSFSLLSQFSLYPSSVNFPFSLFSHFSLSRSSVKSLFLPPPSVLFFSFLSHFLLPPSSLSSLLKSFFSQSPLCTFSWFLDWSNRDLSHKTHIYR